MPLRILDSATLTWVAPTPPAGGYQIEGYDIRWNIGGGNPARTMTAGKDALSLVWTYNTDMTTYTSVEFDIVVVYTANSRSIAVYAYADRPQGAPNLPLNMVERPTQFMVDATSDTSASLTWTAPTPLPGPGYDIVNYEVEWDSSFTGALPRPTSIWLTQAVIDPAAVRFIYLYGQDIGHHDRVQFRIRVQYTTNTFSHWVYATANRPDPMTFHSLTPTNLQLMPASMTPSTITLGMVV